MVGRQSGADRIMRGDPGYEAMLAGRWLAVAATVLCLGVLFSPWQSLVLVGLLGMVPVLAVAAAFAAGGELTLGAVAGTADTRPTAVTALWLPSAALALHAYLAGPALLQPAHDLWAGVIGCAIGMLFILLADPIVRYSPPRSLPLAAVVFMYAAGLAPLVDSMADVAAPVGDPVFAQVVSKRLGGGFGATTYVGLAAWGPMAKGHETAVPADVYGRVSVGDLVCVTVHPGALAMAWYTVGLCPFK